MLNFVVYDLLMEFLEPRPIFLHRERFRVARECEGRFDNDKVIDVGGEGIEADFEPV